MMRTLGVAVLVLLLGARVASSQAPPGGPPVHHGFLDLVPAGHGVLNRTTGNATLTVHGWRYIVANDTNGLRPESERLIVAIGQGQNDFYLAPGSLQSSRGGSVFRYRAPRDERKSPTGLRSFRMVKHPARADCSPLDPRTF